MIFSQKTRTFFLYAAIASDKKNGGNKNFNINIKELDDELIIAENILGYLKNHSGVNTNFLIDRERKINELRKKIMEYKNSL